MDNIGAFFSIFSGAARTKIILVLGGGHTGCL